MAPDRIGIGRDECTHGYDAAMPRRTMANCCVGMTIPKNIFVSAANDCGKRSLPPAMRPEMPFGLPGSLSRVVGDTGRDRSFL